MFAKTNRTAQACGVALLLGACADNTQITRIEPATPMAGTAGTGVSAGQGAAPGTPAVKTPGRPARVAAPGGWSNGVMGRLEEQLAFVAEAGRLRGVLRQTQLTDPVRRENSAEHSWQLAVMVLANNRRVDVSLSTTGQQSTRRYPFNARDYLALISVQGVAKKAPVRSKAKPTRYVKPH